MGVLLNSMLVHIDIIKIHRWQREKFPRGWKEKFIISIVCMGERWDELARGNERLISRCKYVMKESQDFMNSRWNVYRNINFINVHFLIPLTSFNSQFNANNLRSLDVCHLHAFKSQRNHLFTPKQNIKIFFLFLFWISTKNQILYRL